MKKHPTLLPVQKITERLTVYKERPINGIMAHPIASESIIIHISLVLNMFEIIH